MVTRLKVKFGVGRSAALTSGLLLLVGCGYSGVVMDSGSAADAGTGILGGVLHGGQNPIKNATISLYVVGLTGYGSGPASGTAIATTITDQYGNFGFPTSSGQSTYTCPSSGGAANQLLYLVASGGDSGSGANTAIKLMAVLAGPPVHGALTSTDICSTLKTAGQTTSVSINEVSTVVAMSALAQFYNPSTGYIGTSSTNTQGLIDYLTSSQTVTGAAVAYLSPYGGLSGFTLTSTGPFQGYAFDGNDFAYTARLEPVAANRSTYSLTGTLTTKALDAIEDEGDSNLEYQAGQFAGDGEFVFITTATSGDAGSIFQVPGFGQAGSPFTSTTLTTSQSYALNAGKAISGLTNSSPITVDHLNHLYVAAGNSLYQVPYTTTVPSTTSGVTSVSISGTFVTSLALAVDHSNNVWIPSQAGGSPASGYISYYSASGSNVVQDSTSGDGGVNNPTAIAIDGAGNVWVSSAPSLGTSTVSEFALVGGTITPLSPSVGFAHSYATPNSLAVDLSGNVWVANSTVATASVPGTITCILGAASPVVTPIAAGVKNNTLGQLP